MPKDLDSILDTLATQAVDQKLKDLDGEGLSDIGALCKKLVETKEQKQLIELILERAEITKLIDTYLLKLPVRMQEQEWGEFVHGTYNQVVARTGRLSSSAPNMQNNPEKVDHFFESRYDH